MASNFCDPVIGWIFRNKLMTFLLLALFSFAIATLALAVQKSDLQDELDNCNRNKVTGELSETTTTPITTSTTTIIITTTTTPTTTTPTTTTPTTTTTTEGPISMYRLPRTILPDSYELSLTPNLTAGEYSGTVKIALNVKSATNQIVLHSDFSLSIDDMKLTTGETEIKVTHTYDNETNFLTIATETQLQTTTTTLYDLYIEFSGNMVDKIIGFYQSSYRNKDNDTVYIGASKFEPTYARQAFPCFDEPEMKAKYKVELIIPAATDFVALSNMNVEDITSADGMSIVKFSESVSMSTYLLCFVVADFKSQSVTISSGSPDSDFPLSVYTADGQQESGKYALDIGKIITEFYIDYFEIQYPLPKLDMIAIPDYVSGATEHWGLVTFRETSFLWTEGESSTRNKQRVAAVIAHELAHMWFGNLVTMTWWNDIWLNEGFASFIEYKGINASHPEWKIFDHFIVDNLHSVMVTDASVASHPIVQTAEHPDEITALFDSITYNKGASVIRMLENFIGAHNFQTGVTNYLRKYEFGNAETENFLDELDALEDLKLDYKVKEVMNTWIRQKGYPVVEVTKKSTNEFELTQKRFLSNPASEETETSVYDYKWTIPITYITNENDAEVLSWFAYSNSTVTVKLETEPEWIKFNNDQVGYYRVKYPTEIWDSLTDLLDSEPTKLSILNRGHLLNDAFMLADAAEIDYEVALKLTKYLDKEIEYVPWTVATSQFNAILGLLYQSPSNYEKMIQYLRKLIATVYSEVGWKPKDNNEESHNENLLREKILDLACHVELSDCLSKVGEEFDHYISNDEKPNPDIRSIVYYHGIGSSSGHWDIMWNNYLAENDVQEKAKLMHGLAGIKSDRILRRYLELAWDESNVRKQDYLTVLQYIAANPIGENIVWNFVRENWEKLIEKFGLNERTLGRMIPNVTRKFASQLKLQEMEAFFNSTEAGAGQSARNEALENVKYNIEWLEKNNEKISKWLDIELTPN